MDANDYIDNKKEGYSEEKNKYLEMDCLFLIIWWRLKNNLNNANVKSLNVQFTLKIYRLF